MLLPQAASLWVDYLAQLAGLLRDPVFVGEGLERGQGAPVLLIPGFFAGDVSMLVLRHWLERMGYQPFLSGIDLNIGCPDRKSKTLAWRLDFIVQQTGQPIMVIGHSLGGVLARNLAITFPDIVHQVVTLGSPVRNDLESANAEFKPALMALQALWQAFSGGPDECGTHACECGFGRTAAAPLPRPGSLTAIYTRHDGVVDWQSCLDPRARNFEVGGRHTGLLVNAEVYRLVAMILARQFPPRSEEAA